MPISLDKLITKFNEKEKLFDIAMTKKFGLRYTNYREKYLKSFSFEEDLDFPLYLMVEQTYQCNLKCPSCIHGYADEKTKYNANNEYSVMPMDMFKKIVDEGAHYNLPSLGVMVNDEPLLVKNLPERINYAREKGIMDIIMTTNGNLFNEKKIKEVVEAGVTRILFSIDSASEETYKKTRPGKGAFKKVIENMKLLKKYKETKNLDIPYTRASMVVSKNNEKDYSKFRNFFYNLVDGVEFQTFSTYYDKNKDIIPSNSINIDNFICTDPWNKTIIRQNGDVLPCCSFYGYEIPMGNIKTDTIFNIYNSKKFKKIKQEVKSQQYTRKPCIECSKSFYKVNDVTYS